MLKAYRSIVNLSNPLQRPLISTCPNSDLGSLRRSCGNEPPATIDDGGFSRPAVNRLVIPDGSHRCRGFAHTASYAAEATFDGRRYLIWPRISPAGCAVV
jgi:hypothetical protein